MSIRTIRITVCDGCGKAEPDVEIARTTAPYVGFGGKIVWREVGAGGPEEDRKRRDYCDDCTQADIFYCERCHKPHQFECPIDAAEVDAAWREIEAAFSSQPAPARDLEF